MSDDDFLVIYCVGDSTWVFGAEREREGELVGEGRAGGPKELTRLIFWFFLNWIRRVLKSCRRRGRDREGFATRKVTQPSNTHVPTFCVRMPFLAPKTDHDSTMRLAPMTPSLSPNDTPIDLHLILCTLYLSFTHATTAFCFSCCWFSESSACALSFSFSSIVVASNCWKGAFCSSWTDW